MEVLQITEREAKRKEELDLRKSKEASQQDNEERKKVLELVEEFETEVYNDDIHKYFLLLMKNTKELGSFKGSQLDLLIKQTKLGRLEIEKSIQRIDNLLHSAYLLNEESESESDNQEGASDDLIDSHEKKRSEDEGEEQVEGERYINVDTERDELDE